MSLNNQRRAGRKAISKDGERMKTRPVRMTDSEWEKCKEAGGASFIRAQIKAYAAKLAKKKVSNV